MFEKLWKKTKKNKKNGFIDPVVNGRNCKDNEAIKDLSCDLFIDENDENKSKSFWKWFYMCTELIGTGMSIHSRRTFSQITENTSAGIYLFLSIMSKRKHRTFLFQDLQMMMKTTFSMQ